MFLDGPLSKARYEVINAIRRLGERPRDDEEIKLLKARPRSIIDLVLYFEDLLEGNDDSGLRVEEKLHRPSYKMQWGEEKYLEMGRGEEREGFFGRPGGFRSMKEYETLPEEDKEQLRELSRKRGKSNQYRS